MALPNHSRFMLAGQNLPVNVQWQDRYQQIAVGQDIRRALSGGIHVREQSVSQGQAITLVFEQGESYLTQLQYDTLLALSVATGTTYALVWGDWNGSVWTTLNYTVVFDHSNGPAMEFERSFPVWSGIAGAELHTWTGSIHLVRVA